MPRQSEAILGQERSSMATCLPAYLSCLKALAQESSVVDLGRHNFGKIKHLNV